ncbi:hypothetical protein ACFW16_00655 [Inquilinus sp. NPDC058860]|uniref:baeRF3 domain-containing protein n=1 Tax=Inquilinus sp. NPDC058860 TaxID=3346652 RepID=UPI003692D57D
MPQTADIAIATGDRDWLLAAHDPAVTLYVATEPVRRAVGGGGAKLQHLRQALEQRLQGCDLTPERRRDLLAAGEQALSGADFAALDPGFALFLAEDRVETLPLGEAPPQDISAVGHRFLLRPILDRLGPGERFHILAMSAGGTRLLEATRDHWRDITPQDLPHSLSEVVAGTEVEITRQANQPGRGSAAGATSAARHSYESPAELHKTQLIDYIRHVVNAVRRRLAGDPAPVVLVAEPELAGQVRSAGDWPELLPDFVSRHPARLRDEELHAAALLLLPSEDERAAPVLDRIQARLGTAEATVAIKLEEILTAARDGRVDSLLIAADETIWGRFDDDGGGVTARGTRTGGEEDLLNLAAVMTLAAGGTALSLPRARLPRSVPAAAALRY